jgi:hypothetical protein
MKATSATIDGAALVGAILITYAAWMVARPAGFFVAGVWFLGAAIAGARGETVRGAK